MQALRDLQEEMKNMRQELAGRMNRIEQRPAIRPQRRVNLGTAHANTTPTGTAPRRIGVRFNDIPEASNNHQQPEDDPGPFYPQNQNLRRTEEQGDYGEEEEEDDGAKGSKTVATTSRHTKGVKKEVDAATTA